MGLDDRVRQMIEGTKNFGTITTLSADGTPSTHVMWVDTDDDHVLVNTEVHRAKYPNATRDPRVAVTVWDAADPYRYVEVRGRVVGEVRGPEARAHIDQLSRKYTGQDYGTEIQSERVVLRIAADRVHTKNL